jgi:imidazolonepropionase-like amidohydrolase
VLHGRVWPGGAADVIDDGVVLVDADGHIAAVGPARHVAVPSDLPVIGERAAWVGPGIVDAHVHLAFGDPGAVASGAVTAARDLGAPPPAAARWRTSDEPPPGWARVAVAGPLLTAPHGYPSRSWGAAGFASFIAGPAEATQVVRELIGSVDVVKVAIEPSGGPTPDLATVAAVVAAAHEAGLGVTVHALTTGAVRLALAAGVDELAHIPTELLPADVVDALAHAGVAVVSTLQTFVAGGIGDAPLANARALFAAGVTIRYGTDLGNAGTRPGVDPDELELLAGIGMGRVGALRAATDVAAGALGMDRSGATGLLRVGDPADAVVLAGDPVEDPARWRAPVAVLIAGRAVTAEPPPTLSR